MSRREIKFRAWNGQFMEYGGFAIHATGQVFNDAPGLSKIAPDSPIMQYTGMKDEDGRDIYEGDILRSSYGIPPRAVVGPVEYVGTGFFVHIPESRPLAEFIEHLGQVWVDGNIYQPPRG